MALSCTMAAINPYDTAMMYSPTQVLVGVSAYTDDITYIMTLISKCFAETWEAHAIPSQTLVHLKGWWDKSCAETWSRYRESDCSSDEWRNM